MLRSWDHDEEREKAWAALSHSLQKALPELFARFDAQIAQASETLAGEIEAYLGEQEKE